MIKLKLSIAINAFNYSISFNDPIKNILIFYENNPKKKPNDNIKQSLKNDPKFLKDSLLILIQDEYYFILYFIY
jgi:hypothetical protein